MNLFEPEPQGACAPRPNRGDDGTRGGVEKGSARRWIIRVVAALLAVAIATPASAAAAGEPEWRRMACFSGAIDEVVPIRGLGLIRLEGHVDCAHEGLDQVYFGFARYHAKEAMLYRSAMSAYSPVAPSSISIEKFLPDGDFAVCLVTDVEVRVACVKVTREGITATVAPLPTDDPLVDQPVVVIGRDSEPSPVCGHCW